MARKNILNMTQKVINKDPESRSVETDPDPAFQVNPDPDPGF
jgi:hypothetical protein